MEEGALSILVAALWWIFFWSAVGLCLGSFLNVIIYRVPRDQSLRDPVWSACPLCGHRIRWYDNLPVVSFLRLRGRCRDCAAPIATRYAVVELLMALLVLLVLDAFFIAEIRRAFDNSAYITLNDHLALNWPIMLAHVILLGCLLSMSAIDLEHYWVDVRFTNIATIAGFVLHTIWTPRLRTEWPRPGDATSWVSLGALAGLGGTWAIFALFARRDEEAPETTAQPPTDLPAPIAPPPPSDEAVAPADAAEPRVEAVGEPSAIPAEGDPIPAVAIAPPPPSRAIAWLLGLVFLALVAALVAVEGFGVKLPHAPRALVPIVLLFLIIVAESWHTRESDQQIMDAIDEERTAARGMVMRELALLLPAVALGGLAWYLFRASPEQGSAWLHHQVAVPGLDLFRHWQPLHGLATAAAGYIIGGAIGWAVRIVFTLAFGKEAFGTGDIHLLAAAGCVAGWPVAVLGFILACLLALAGWMATLPKKSARAIPLGPWLSLGFLIIIVFYEPLLRWRPIAGVIDAANLLIP